jgi:hypothetical protein
VRHQHLPGRDFAQILAANGLPQEFADIIAGADRGLARGEWFTDSGDLQRLIGRPTTPLADVIADAVRERLLTTAHPARPNGEQDHARRDMERRSVPLVLHRHRPLR